MMDKREDSTIIETDAQRHEDLKIDFTSIENDALGYNSLQLFCLTARDTPFDV